VDVAGHDADLALLGLDDAGAVGPDDSGLVLGLECVLDLDHVLLRDAIGDHHHQFDFGFDGLHDGVGGAQRRHVDDAGVALGVLLGLLAVLEDGEPEVCRAGLLGGDAAHHLGAVLEGLLGLEGALSQIGGTWLPVMPWQITLVCLFTHTYGLLFEKVRSSSDRNSIY
jgi:hypothetical protein